MPAVVMTSIAVPAAATIWTTSPVVVVEPFPDEIEWHYMYLISINPFFSPLRLLRFLASP
jgi:hypothetical protein